MKDKLHRPTSFNYWKAALMPITLLSIDPMENASILFFASLLLVVVLYELLSGQSAPSRWGGWVTTRAKEPTEYWVFLLLKVAGILALIGYLAFKRLNQG